MNNLDSQLKMFFAKRKTFPYIRPIKKDTTTLSFYGNINKDHSIFGIMYSLLEDTFFYVSRSTGTIKLSQTERRNLPLGLRQGMMLVAKDRVMRKVIS